MKGLILKYFVLNPTSNDAAFREASIAAIFAFARDIAKSEPQLASDLEDWMIKLTRGNP